MREGYNVWRLRERERKRAHDSSTIVQALSHTCIRWGLIKTDHRSVDVHSSQDRAVPPPLLRTGSGREEWFAELVNNENISLYQFHPARLWDERI